LTNSLARAAVGLLWQAVERQCRLNARSVMGDSRGEKDTGGNKLCLVW